MDSLAVEADDVEAFRAAVAETLAAGRFRLVLAVDGITPELRRVVEFLNAHTVADTSVVALELGYGNEGGVEVLVPRVYGVELAAVKRGTSSVAQMWTQEDLYGWLAENQPDALEPIRRFLDRFQSRVVYYFYGTSKTPAATAVVKTPVECQPFTVWTSEGGWTGVSINFDYMHRFGDAPVRRLLEPSKRFRRSSPVSPG